MPNKEKTEYLLRAYRNEILECGDLERNEWLFHQGVRPGDACSDGWTVLMVVCALNYDPSCASFWLSKCDDADLKATDEEGRPLLLLVNDVEVARTLIERGADVSRTMPDGDCLFVYHGTFNVEMFNEFGRQFVDKGGDINFRGDNGRSPIHRLASEGSSHSDLHALALATELGADVNARDDLGRTPLMCADADMAVKLLWAGADASLMDNEGNTALTLANAVTGRDGRALVQLLEGVIAGTHRAGHPDGNSEKFPTKAEGFSFEDLLDHLEKVVTKNARNAIAAPIMRPHSVSGADWLAAMDPGFAASPLACWAGRHESRVLELVAELYSKSPNTCTDPDAWNSSEWNNNGPALLQALTTGSAWAIEALTEPFYDHVDVDRRSSFIGGFPWTCEEFPWPLDRRSKALSPLFQLNLAELDLRAIAEFPPLLIQGWGDDTDFVTRTIPLTRIAERTPDCARLPYRQKHLGYLGNKKGSIGSRLSTGRTHFSLFTGLADILINHGLTERHRAALDTRVAEVEVIIQAIAEELNNVENSAPEYTLIHHFGGQHVSNQGRYAPWEGGKVLYEYRSFDGFDKQQDGLNIYWDGRMWVYFSPADLGDGYQVHADR